MKTLLQIANEHIEETAKLVDNPELFKTEGIAMMRRMQERYANDPALGVFTLHFAEALRGTLPMFPPPMHAAVIQSLIVQVIIEWGDIVKEYEEQMQPKKMQDVTPPVIHLPGAGEKNTVLIPPPEESKESVDQSLDIFKKIGQAAAEANKPEPSAARKIRMAFAAQILAELDDMIATARKFSDDYGRDKAVGLIAARQKIEKIIQK